MSRCTSTKLHTNNVLRTVVSMKGYENWVSWIGSIEALVETTEAWAEEASRDQYQRGRSAKRIPKLSPLLTRDREHATTLSLNLGDLASKKQSPVIGPKCLCYCRRCSNIHFLLSLTHTHAHSPVLRVGGHKDFTEAEGKAVLRSLLATASSQPNRLPILCPMRLPWAYFPFSGSKICTQQATT